MNNKYIRLMALCLATLTVTLLAVGLFTPRAVHAQDTGLNWTAYYWNNQTFTGAPTLYRIDPVVNFNWGAGSPDPSIPSDHFSARWSNKINFSAGTFRFRAGADDGIRVAIDGNMILNRWSDATTGFTVQNADIQLTAGVHEIVVDYYENAGDAGVLFDWTSPTGGTSSTVGVAGATPAPVSSVGAVLNSVPVPPVKAVVIASIANVRSGPATNFPPIAEIYINEVYDVVAQNGVNTWFVIRLKDGRKGWVFRRMVYLYNGDWTKLPTSSDVTAPNAPVVDVQGVAAVMVMVRNAPSLRNSDKIGTINQGESFKVLKLSTNRAWVLVDYNGFRGWVYLPNVKIVVGSLGRLPVGNS